LAGRSAEKRFKKWPHTPPSDSDDLDRPVQPQVYCNGFLACRLAA